MECSSNSYRKFSRENTVLEKRSMNKSRRKRKSTKKKMKAKMKQLREEVSAEMKLRKEAERLAFRYKQISRTYWERWRWELHKRKETMKELGVRNPQFPSTSDKYLLHEIDPSMLEDPVVDGTIKTTFLARGCFGIVRLQHYRTLQVAVKEFLPRSISADVKAEASILASLSHPYVPFLLGICTKDLPLRVIMQYHSVDGTDVSTFCKELNKA